MDFTNLMKVLKKDLIHKKNKYNKNIKVTKNNWINKIVFFITKNYLLTFVFLFIVGFIVYANVLKGPMFFDDEHFIQKNKYVQNLDIKKIYTTSVTDGANMPGNFYRPNQQLVYSIIYQFFGETSWPYHLTSIFFHIINAVLIFIISKKLKFSKTASLLASMFFLLHPIQTESVSYISGLADPMSLSLLLSGIIFLLKSLEKEGTKFDFYFKMISLLFYIAALFTKENMVIFMVLSVLIIVVYNILYDKKIINNRYSLYYIIITFLVTITYLILKFTVFNFSEYRGLTGFSNVYTRNLHIRILTFISILWDYFKMLIFPFNLNYEKPYVAYTDWFTWRAAFGYILIAFLIFTIMKFKTKPCLCLSSVWFFASLIPYTGIIPLNAMYLEHWLYVPVAGVSFFIASAYDKFKKLKKDQIMIFIMIPVFLLYSVRVIARNEEWADIEKFYLNELKYSKNSLRIYNNLGLYYADVAEKNKENKQYFWNMNRKAESCYKKAISIADIYPQPYHNLGNIYLSEGRIKESFDQYIFALSIDSNFVYSLIRIAEIYEQNGNLKKAKIFKDFVSKIESGEKITFAEIQKALVSE